MQSFKDLTERYLVHFNKKQFPEQPINLYEPAEYFVGLGGKRVRPVMCLMTNELFGEITPDAWTTADALELFHNFTLLHDDVMDQSVVRRGKPTVHARNGLNTAILSGDAMLIVAYQKLQQVDARYLPKILEVFNKTALEVCEGQQYDMDFEHRNDVSMDEYLQMITLKTSVLLACSAQLGGILGNTTQENIYNLYEFGKNLGIAFQIQDDYLDCYGQHEKFGKEIGADIKRNKKTFLLIKALASAQGTDKDYLQNLLNSDSPNKVAEVLNIYATCGVKEWAEDLKNYYARQSLIHLDNITVSPEKKEHLMELSDLLLNREH